MYYDIANKFTMSLWIVGTIIFTYLIFTIIKYNIIKKKYLIIKKEVEQEDENNYGPLKKEVFSFVETFILYKEKFYSHNKTWNKFIKKYGRVISKSDFRDKVEEEINKFRPVRQEKKAKKWKKKWEKIKKIKKKELDARRNSNVEIREDKRFRNMGSYHVDYKSIFNKIIIIIFIWCLLVAFFLTFSESNFVIYFINNINNKWHIIILLLPVIFSTIYLILEDMSDIFIIIIKDIIIMMISFLLLTIIDIIIFWIIHSDRLINIFVVYQNWLFAFLLLVNVILIYIIRIIASNINKMDVGIKQLNDWKKRYNTKEISLEVDDAIGQIKIFAENLYTNLCFGKFEILKNESIEINEEQLLFSRIDNVIKSNKDKMFGFIKKEKCDVKSISEIYRDYMVYDQILGQQMIFDFQSFSKRVKEINSNLDELYDIDNY